VNRSNVVNVLVVLVFISFSQRHSKSFLFLCFCLWQIFVSWFTQMFEAWHAMCLCGFSCAAWSAQQVHMCDHHVCLLWCPTYKRRHSNFMKCCRNAWHHALLALQDKERFISRWLRVWGELCVLQFLTTRVNNGVKGGKRETPKRKADFSSSSCKLAFPLHLLVLEVCKGEGSVKENWRKRKTWLLFCFCMLDNVDS